MEIVTTCHGMNLPLFCKATLAARSSPPQQGTSIRSSVTERMSFPLSHIHISEPTRLGMVA